MCELNDQTRQSRPDSVVPMDGYYYYGPEVGNIKERLKGVQWVCAISTTFNFTMCSYFSSLLVPLIVVLMGEHVSQLLITHTRDTAVSALLTLLETTVKKALQVMYPVPPRTCDLECIKIISR